ncbi:methylated-DNA--[protein]-cysteine S-methyltransferase [Paucilactobacillus kaifaensis]|uniref:methylated-DNA--[protein]-cysteine S-methyltransferase n=1 Tax=Paucilactobacillus kaifaensis TaxID=2559921 RepID=UPI001CC4D721|nr:methylated-DNA--[protein]-cysteine S-methyltransferase [Paucilactobacillus kaifaensis]
MELYYDIFKFNDHQYYLIASDSGLCFVGSPDAELAEADGFFATDNLTRNPDKLAQVKTQLQEFLSGSRQNFDLALDAQFGTPLQRKVWQTLTTIKYGETLTYQQLAHRIGHPTAIRAVASAVGRNPWMIVVPCHRVIRTDHTMGGYRGGLPLKTALLKLESSRTALTF